MHIHIGLESSVFGGLIIPVCSYILSESYCAIAQWFEVCLVLCCRFEPLLAELHW